MAVNVVVSKMVASTAYPNGTDVNVADGHLVVTAAWDPERKTFPRVAVYAPGQWTHANVSN
jgi:hypothetical protein